MSFTQRERERELKLCQRLPGSATPYPLSYPTPSSLFKRMYSLFPLQPSIVAHASKFDTYSLLYCGGREGGEASFMMQKCGLTLLPAQHMVCYRERDRAREGEGEIERARETARQRVCLTIKTNNALIQNQTKSTLAPAQTTLSDCLSLSVSLSRSPPLSLAYL